ncbi:trichohyalin-like [Branchiostoma lanceolatum]|uniref:trichohyalin-like n=1 Tax=Branchiostoma lanceolatum TaxID=7740 RepID=UPI003454D029
MTVLKEAILVVLVLAAVCCGQAAQWEAFSNPFCGETGSYDDVIPMAMRWPHHPSLSLRHHPGHAVITPRALHMHPLLWSSSLMHDINMVTGFPNMCSCQTRQEETYNKQEETPSPHYQCQHQPVPGEEEKVTRRPEPSSATGQQQQDQEQEDMEEMIQKENCKGSRQPAKNSPLHTILEETEDKRKVEEDGRRDWEDEHLRAGKKRPNKTQQDKLMRDRREWEKIKAQQERQQREREAQIRRDAARQQAQQRQSDMHQKSQARQQSQHNSREQTSHRTPPKVPMSQVASVQINGYYPENIQVRTEGRQLIVSGKQTCSCEEQCFEKEFERQYALPRGLDTRSLRATLNRDGQLRVEGQVYRGVTQRDDVRVEVQGLGIGQRPQVEDPTCGGRKSGFRLRKTAQRRKSAAAADLTEDVPRFEKYQDEEENDGVTIEVVED